MHAHDPPLHQAIIPGQAGQIKAKPRDPSPLFAGSKPPGQTTRVVPIQHHDALALKYPGLGCRIAVHPCMTIQVIFADIEHRRGISVQAIRRFQLEARQFEHPDLGQTGGLLRRHQRIQGRR